MKNLLVSLLFAFSSLGFAQTFHIPKDATVYIEPADGFENFLATALLKTNTPLKVVAEKEKAELTIKATLNKAQSTSRFSGEYDTLSVNIQIIDQKTSSVIYAYSSEEYPASEMKYIAEECAYDIKKTIKKSK